jgi:Ca2+-binding RTX toxin-like protein
VDPGERLAPALRPFERLTVALLRARTDNWTVVGSVRYALTLTLAAAGLLLATAPGALAAQAEEVLVSSPPEGGSAYYTANYTNGAAENNVLFVHWAIPVRQDDVSLYGVRFTDLARHTIHAGTNCRSLAANSVNCGIPCLEVPGGCEFSPGLGHVVADLGPGNDTFYVGSNLTSPLVERQTVWVEGGAGDDVIYGGQNDGNLLADRLSGGPGNDVIVASDRFTQISCGSGIDTVILALVGRPQVPADCEIVVPKRY